MRLITSTVLAFVWVACSAAEGSILVRGGEHGDYSRVVIPDAPAGWSVSLHGREIEIGLPGENDYILDDLVAKRMAHRVLSAQVKDFPDARRLSLKLACDCSAQSSLSADGSLIIDISHRSSGARPSSPARKTGAVNNLQKDEFEVARDRLIALLAEANNNGVITIKQNGKKMRNEGSTPPAPLKPATTPVYAAMTPAPDDQNEPDISAAPIICFDVGLFRASDSDGDYDALVDIRHRLDGSNPDDIEKNTQDLAAAYLRIGFFEEAHAIASAHMESSLSEMALIANLAALAGGLDTKTPHIFDRLSSCGPDYEMLSAAARARIAGEAPTEFSDPHFAALNSLTASLRAPIAEYLALAALDKGEKRLAHRFYEVAAASRNGEKSPALAVLAAALENLPNDQKKPQDEIIKIAQTPGPMQSRALAEIAKSNAGNPSPPYDGFLDDLSDVNRQAQTLSRSNASASLTGAEMLASGGRIGEALAILKRLAVNDSESSAAAQQLAQKILTEALEDEALEKRYQAISAYLSHGDFIDDAQLSLTIAGELADLGAVMLTRETLAKAGLTPSIDQPALLARAHYNSLAETVSSNFSQYSPDNLEALYYKIRAAERLGDDETIRKKLESLIRQRKMSPKIARAALRASDWNKAAASVELLDSDALNPELRERIALAALADGQAAPPAAASILLDGPEAEALAHMFAGAPRFDARRLDSAGKFASGVEQEIKLMQRRISGE